MVEELKANNPLAKPTIVDPHKVPVSYVDWIVTSGVGPAPGVVTIALASIDYALPGSESTPEAILQCRLRMGIPTVQNLIRILQGSLDAMMPAAPDQTVN